MKYPEYYEVHDHTRVRFQSVLKEAAIEHAQRVYRDERIICAIEVMARVERKVA